MAGWSFLDAIYMVVITIFGVGYGEVRALDSPQLKVFTMLVIVAGTSSAVYTVGGFIQMVTEGEITKALDARRMTRSIESLEESCNYLWVWANWLYSGAEAETIAPRFCGNRY
jgi:voltage-gated potassium channel